MIQELFLDKFDKFAESPNAIEKMRELILRLAMTGKLVDQNAAEPSGAEVYISIQKIRAKQSHQKVAAKTRSMDLLRAGDDIDLPRSWYRCAVEDVCDLRTGATPSTQEPRYFGGKIRWLVSGDINRGEIFECEGRISELGLANSNCKIIPKNSVLIALNGQGRTRATVAVLRVEAALNQSLVAMIPYSREDLLPEFLFWNLRSRYRAIRDVTGQEQRRGLNMRLVGQLSLPLPPVEEQRRIVGRVQELMKLCDRLEAHQKEHETRHVIVTRAALARFNEVPVTENLSFLFHKSYSISPAELRRTILSLAVRGKLLTRNTDDEPAKELLKRIAERRRALLYSGYPSKSESTTQAKKQSEQLLPGNLQPLPHGWAWATLLQSSLLIVDCHNKTAPYTPNGIRLLRTTNIRNGRLNLSEPKFVSETTYKRWSSRCKPEPGDILITREAPMGEVCIIPEGMTVCMGQRMMLIRLVPEMMNSQFVLYSLMDPALMERVQDKPVGATVQHLRVGGVETLLMPIPPLAEQSRIVARVDQLMALVDRLEEQITASQAKSGKLFDALIHEILHPKREIAGRFETVPKNSSQRSTVGCHAIDLLAGNPHFGRTMLMKVFYLSEAHCGIAQGWQPLRQAAGPYDPTIEDFEAMGIQREWFTFKKKVLSNGYEMVQYQSKGSMEAKIAEVTSVLDRQQAEFDRLLGLFQDKTTEEAEIIATLFAAWNDLLIDGKSPSDDEIIREVRENWHYKKERFTPTLLARWLNWLRQQSVIPRGLAPRTRQQLKLGLS